MASTMNTAGLFAACLGMSLALAPAAQAQTQAYPNKPVRLVMPYSAGSGPDALIRAMSDLVGKELGQPLVVDNRPGGNGWIGVGEGKRSAPDGYTILMADANIMTLHQHLFKQVPFDAARDFESIAPLYSTNYFVVTTANSPWNNLSDLLAAARQKEGAVSYASWGIGSPGHVGAAMLETAAGVKLHHVPYKDIPGVYVAAGNGEVNWALGTAGSIGPMLAAKRIKLLAYTGTSRFAAHPDVATVAEQGGSLSGYELSTWAALFAPKGTPPAVLEKVRAAFAKALIHPDIRARLNTFGFNPWFATRAEFSKAMAADSAKYKDVIARAKISLQ